ncbi:MAG: hypothetical protein GQ574_07430 [Crocinitomix sp.]|nr:hypothetical protein [Crocinitomix sp.]
MERTLTKNNTIHLLFLELVSITPILIILGNVVPPMPIKIHHMGLGIIFLIMIWALMSDPYKKWILYVAGAYTLIQFTHEQWYLKGLVDYFFGPFALLLLLDILVNQKLPKATLLKYERRFYYLLWVPIAIAVLQYFNLFPIKLWNATYVNFAYFGDLAIPRPNGLLYHGSELSVIICFMALFQFFKKENKAVWMLLLLVMIAFMTYFKALIGCAALLFLYYIVFVNRGVLAQFKLISKKRIIFYAVLIVLILTTVALRFFSQVYTYTGYLFVPDMLTGRGAIWNIYIERIKDFTFWNYLFGNGMGSSFDIFADYATADTWYLLAADPNADTDYDTHNAVLSVFINSGIIGLAFIFYLFRMVWNQIKKWAPNGSWNKTIFFGIFIIPLITIGITIPIYENAIFWIALGFLIYRWKFYTDDEGTVET